jgi:hypothetical protein
VTYPHLSGFTIDTLNAEEIIRRMRTLHIGFPGTIVGMQPSAYLFIMVSLRAAPSISLEPLILCRLTSPERTYGRKSKQRMCHRSASRKRIKSCSGRKNPGSLLIAHG